MHIHRSRIFLLSCVYLGAPGCSGVLSEVSPDAAAEVSPEPAPDAAPDAAIDAAPPDAGKPPPPSEVVADFPALVQRDLDLLFVIDNSASMAEEQAWLTDGFGRLIEVLESIEGGLPNLHLGVVSTDLGASQYVSSCRGAGDDGLLQHAPTEGCALAPGFLDDAFIRNVATAAGSDREINYQGDLRAVFSCIARLGTGGCGFEQPLEAMRRALDGERNPGFLRPDATLGVVILSDEDDCSAADRAMFDPSDDSLGPLDSFRCFEHGVVCEPDEPRRSGTKSSCQPRQRSQYMYGIQEYIDFLVALKGAPDRVFVAAITGPAEPVEVRTESRGGSRLVLAPSCTSSFGNPAPAVRLRAFLDGFAGHAVMQPICEGGQEEALRAIATGLAAHLGSACMLGPIDDIDPSADGIQPWCEVVEVPASGTETPLPACDEPADPDRSTNRPCFLIAAAPDQCAHTASQLRVSLYRDGVPAPDMRVRVRCQLE